ncbi:hypothetical protein CFOL_v3_16830, partial [Cephalotus follicularis]
DTLLTAAYILNRVSSQSISSTPYELWNNQKPNLNHLRPWGAAGYVQSTSHRFGKLGPRARKHIFIRYSDSSKGYVMYGEHPDGGGMTEVESHDVIFLEDEYPSLGETSKNLDLFESEDSGSILPSLGEGGKNIPYPIVNDNRSDPQSSGSIPDNKSVSPQNIQNSQVRKSKRGTFLVVILRLRGIKFSCVLYPVRMILLLSRKHFLHLLVISGKQLCKKSLILWPRTMFGS